jgi:hypothetical protein
MLIRTIKNGIHERVRFNNAPWEDMLPYVVMKYNNTIHTSTGYKPKEAIDDKSAMDIKMKLELNARTKRRLSNVSIGDKVKVYKKAGKYGESKESKSRWYDEVYEVIGINTQHSTFYKLQGRAKEYLRHELLIVS